MTVAADFSPDGMYYAQLTADGKLKIWNTISGKLEQEFTPDLHLSAPCTCLHFMTTRPYENGKIRKKQKRKSVDPQQIDECVIVLGTKQGSLLFYSVEKADLVGKADSVGKQMISCISWREGSNDVFAGADQSILHWNSSTYEVIANWKTGNSTINAMAAVAGDMLATASTAIKLWNVASRELIRQFTGHSSPVITLKVCPGREGQLCLISGSRSDRVLSCWDLSQDHNDKYATSNYALGDAVVSVHVFLKSEGGQAYITACVKSGAGLVFRTTLGEKSVKPIKPINTIKIASDRTINNQVIPIPIVVARMRDENKLTVAYGSSAGLIFENLSITTSEETCLVRSVAGKKSKRGLQIDREAGNAQVITPIVNNSTTYLNPLSNSKVIRSVKRKPDGTPEIAMEDRLANMTVMGQDSTPSIVPIPKNMAKLLMLGLASNDKLILRAALRQEDESVISSTVKKLKLKTIIPLVTELCKYLNSRTIVSKTGTLWLKHVLKQHTSLLISNPDLADILTPVMTSMEARQALFLPLSRLSGRLDLLISQVDVKSRKSEDDEGDNVDEALLVYNDKLESDDELAEVDATVASDSDMEEWNDDANSNSGSSDDSDAIQIDSDDSDEEVEPMQNGHKESDSETDNDVGDDSEDVMELD